jgi:hypothetical protein
VIIEQADIAHLTDDQVKLMVLAIVDTVGELDGPGPSPGPADFWRRLAVGLVRARRLRVAAFHELTLDALNDDGPGALVEPGSDPVVEALDTLRRHARGEGFGGVA